MFKNIFGIKLAEDIYKFYFNKMLYNDLLVWYFITFKQSYKEISVLFEWVFARGNFLLVF